MNTHQILKNTASEANFQWLQDMYAVIDQKDVKAWRTFLAEDAIMKYANNPLVEGADQIIESISYFFNSIQGLNHSFVQVLEYEPNTFFIEWSVTYIRLDEKVVVLPATTLIKKNNQNLMTELKVFIDVAPIYQ